MFSPEDQKALTQTVKGSELELRFSDPSSFSFSKVNYDIVVKYLISIASSIRTEKYTNYYYPGNYRLSIYEDGRRTLIKKTKVENRAPFDKSFIPFRVRLGEAEEENVDERLVKTQTILSREPTFTRQITRTIYEVEELTFECSEIVASDDKKSYEIEVEIGGHGVKSSSESAARAISIVTRAFMKEDRLPENAVTKEVSYLTSDLNQVRLRLGDTKGPVTNLSFAKNPVNLKERDIGSLNAYALTHKLDGERKLLISLRKGELLVVHPRGYDKEKPKSAYYLPITDAPPFILDAEYYNNQFHVFDVILLGDEFTIDTDLSHQKRMKKAAEQVQIDGVVFKKFYYEDFNSNIRAFMNDNTAEWWFENCDGFIFSQKSPSYSLCNHLKFKFSSKMSIDFGVKKIGTVDGQFKYSLQSSNRGQREDFKKQTLLTFAEYDREILECVYYKNRWVVLRIREDKTFPNATATAESVFEDILKPISFSKLVSLADEQQSDYIDKITKLEAGFFVSHAKAKDQLLHQAVDLYLKDVVYHASRFFGPYGNERYLADVTGKLLMGGASERYRLQQVAVLTGEQYPLYANRDELDIISGCLGEEAFQDIRSGKVINLAVMGQARESHTAGVSQIEIPEDSNFSFGKFSENVIKQDQEYNKYTTVERVKEAISQYSSLMPWHKAQVSSQMQQWFPNLSTMADMTAHVGIDSFHMEQLYPGIKIDAFEIHPNIFYALRDNCVKLKSTVRPFLFDSCFDAYMNWQPNQYDLVYIDAPWGGKGYAAIENLDLYLQAESDSNKLRCRNVVHVAQFLLSRQITKAVVLKVPKNFNTKPLDLFDSEIVDVVTQDVYTKTKKVSYKLIRLLPRVGGLSKLVDTLVWSVPYTDSLERIFSAGHSRILVRAEEDELKDAVNQVLLEWNLPCTSSSPSFLIKEEDLMKESGKKGYHYSTIFNKGLVKYYYFTRKDGGAIQIAQKPVQRGLRIVQVPPEDEEEVKSQPAVQMPAAAQLPVKLPVKLPAQLPVKLPAQLPAKLPAQADVRDSFEYMRKYHNTEKRNLISLYCKNRSVLDLGAGKGGDLFKYKEADVTKLILIEPNQENINAPEDGLVARLQNMGGISSITTIIPTVGQDTKRITEQVFKDRRVNVVSSFFSMTFLFEKIQILREFLTTVNSCLLEGGYFIGTMMDGQKSYDAFRGKKQIVYDKATIVKHYNDDEVKVEPGHKIWINIQDTIVKNQDEYLAFFPVLQRELEEMGFVLELRYDFRPDLSFESKFMNEQTLLFSSLNISFVFRKMPKLIPNKIFMIKENEMKEYFNLYGEMTPMYRVGVQGDGSCFIHAYLYLVSENYQKANSKDRQQLVREVRQQFSQWLTLKQYMKLLPLQIHTRIEKILEGKEGSPIELDYHSIVPMQYSEDFMENYEALPENIKTYMNGELEKLVEYTKKRLASTETYIVDSDIILFMDFTNTNIYIFDIVNRTPSLLLLNQYKVSRKTSIAILNLNQYHYEPLIFGVKDKTEFRAKRVLLRSDPQLIYMHQWLLKKNVSR